MIIHIYIYQISYYLMCISIYNDNSTNGSFEPRLWLSDSRLVVPPGPCHGAGSVSARHAGATPRAPAWRKKFGDLTRHAMWMLRG